MWSEVLAAATVQRQHFYPSVVHITKVKPQHGCHVPQGRVQDILFFSFLKQELFIAVSGALDINWKADEKATAYPM